MAEAANWLSAVPPSDTWRSADPATLLARVKTHAAAAGVTRLAELTHLDRIGLPVFQAIRPLSRSLSVHQGKGRDDDTARLSAVMEAIESRAAECVTPDGPYCRHGDLAETERAARDSYAELDASRPHGPDAKIRWLAAENIGTGGRLHVPFDVVSQDFTFEGDTAFVRSSLGLASGASIADATLAALFEIIERDAQADWLYAGIVGQTGARVDMTTIELDWFQALACRMQELGLRLSVYAATGRAGVPVVMCRIDEPGYAPSFLGTACRFEAGDALLRAFGEAAQSRLTIISGSRDDIAPDEPARRGMRALGMPTGRKALDWRRIAEKPDVPGSLDALCHRLAAEGFHDIARVDLSPASDVGVVKMIVPGLAASPACHG